ncbi:MAG TPA: class I SAM-dependent methyltransferase [Candidatus Binatia bacterium]|nr:class I SAM-dependent methyltransferase [Candidatus Binatia bacterium]
MTLRGSSPSPSFPADERTPGEWGAAQKDHYDHLAAQYDAHYGDQWSQRYRREFIDEPLLAGLDIRGREVLEAMCGSGQTTAALLERGAHVTGLDISEAGMESFRRRWPDCRAVCASITESGLPSECFDAVVIVAGLHHLHPDVPKALAEIHRVLRPGGTLCFMEPHSGSVPDLFRRIWYRFDRLFLANEAAIDIVGLREQCAGKFIPVVERYGGNIAFLLVLNSMVFRLPVWLKAVYAPLVLWVERLLSRWGGKRFSCFAICQWRKCD